MIETNNTYCANAQRICTDLLPQTTPLAEGTFEHKKVVIITGASQGIGKSTALLLAERGWSVWATTRDRMKCDLNHKKIQVLEVKLDSTESIQNAVQHILKKENHIDALINNAGHMLIAPAEESSIANISHLFEINVMAPIKFAQAVLPNMRARNCGRIINLSSGAAIQSSPGLAAFSASKAALHSFFQAMAAELLFWNIKITSLEVGSVQTPWIQNCLIPQSGEVAQYNNFCQSFTKRLIQKNEIAEDPADVAREIAALLESEAPAPRKAASEAMNTFMAQHLVDASGERYMEQQRRNLLLT